VSGDASKADFDQLIGSKFGNAPGDASEMGRSESFMRTPGHTGVVTYRSDVIAFGTAKVSEAATTARRDVRATYKGPDPLGLRGSKWNKSVTPDYGTYNRHLQQHTTRNLLDTAVGTVAPCASQRRDLDDALLKTGYSTSTAFAKVSTSGSWEPSTKATAKEMGESLRRTGLAARANSEEANREMTRRKEYKPPWKIEEERMAAMREAKRKGHWPKPPPPIELAPGTRRAKTRRADLQAVLELDDFVPPPSRAPTPDW